MGCCGSKSTADGSFEPSCFARAVAIKDTSDYKESAFDVVHTAQAKVLVVCTDEGKLQMANGKVFNSGNHVAEVFVPLLHIKAAGLAIEFATASGNPVVLEMWGFPHKDVAVSALFEELKPQLEAPKKLEEIDISLNGYAGIFIPGGHGAMISLPENQALGKLLHAAHAASMPTLALCHGPAALLSASKLDGAEFCYKGYSMVTFSDKTDAVSPKIGYMPGPMPWLVQKALTDQGAQTLNTAEKGATHVDRELITGDSPDASNAVGLIAAPMMVTYAAKAEAAP